MGLTYLALAAATAAFAPPLHAPQPLRLPLRKECGVICSDAPSSAGEPGSREVDSRGFVIPQVGDVVKMPSKWPGEWEVGQVDFVQFIGARASYEVDLLTLDDIGGDLYRLPGKKPSKQTLDVAKLGRVGAEYVPERDAYRIDANDLEPLGGRKPEDPDVTAQGLQEYADLKAELLREAALLGAAGTLAAQFTLGGDVSFALAAGSIAGCVYLALLQKETDKIDDNESMGKVVAALVGGRLGVPVVLMAILASKQLAATGGPASFSLVPKEQFGAAITGFLAYKVPLLVRQIATAVKELGANRDAQAPLTAGAMPTGSLGVAVRLAQNRIKSEQDKRAAEESDAAEAGDAAGASKLARLVVICGPSGVGKSTLIAKLLEDFPETYGFSVSCTTRAPRAGEVNGVDYNFLPDTQFDGMVDRGDFIEYAQVGGQRYGTSIAGVQEVSSSGKVCLLDLDVQGVQALVQRKDIDPFCVWLAPPSLDDLRARLRARGSEDSAEIERRITRATQEIEVSLTSDIFDKIVLNENLDEAYAGLKDALTAGVLKKR